MASSLTGIFASGAPQLAEELRTLVLEPRRAVTPGETIRAHWVFSNLGGAAATGVRVRFAHPQGVTHIEDADTIDDGPLELGERFVDTTGAHIGDLEPNAQRKVGCSFRVDDTIEDGTELVFQAALVTDQTPLVASNVERIVVQAAPELRSSATLVTLVAPESPKPGDVLTVRATIANTGPSSAHDVVLILPTPEHTTYVARSARIDGRLVTGIDGEAFDYDRAAVVCERLGAGRTVTIEFQAEIESPLADGTRLKANGIVAARETPEVHLSSAEIVVTSPVDFENEETALTILCDDVVTPGMRVPMLMRVSNAGTGIAERVSVVFNLPPGLVYAPGSAHADGAPVSDDAIGGLSFVLPMLGAGRSTELGLAATVAVPVSEETALPVEATLRWKNGSRSFARRLQVRVASRFNRARNYVDADRGVAQARDEVRFTVHVYNDGTAAEQHVRLRLIPGLYLTDVRIAESSDEIAVYSEPLDLGRVEPHHERTFVVFARLASRVPDRSHATLGVALEHAAGAIDLGSATIVVRSRPAVEHGAWELAGADRELLRPNRSTNVVIRFTNTGSDVLRDARIALTLPPELVVERAVDARRDRDGLVIPEVAAETTHEAHLTLRLVREPASGRTLYVNAWLHARGISPLQFPVLEIPTFAEPQFAANSHLGVFPSEAVNAGDRLQYDLRVRNDGDGAATRLAVRVVPTNLAVYVPSSTSINALPLPDDGGLSPLWSQRGLVLADVNPGAEVRIRFEMVVMSPLAAGTPLETRAILEWGDQSTLALIAPSVRVQSQPAFAENTFGSTISIARLFPETAMEPEMRALPEPAPEPAVLAVTPIPATHEPPHALAEVIARGTERLETQPSDAPQAALPEAATDESVQPSAPPHASSAVLFLDLTPERLTHTIRMLERSEAGGLIQHLFAMRLLFPENALGATPQLSGALASASRAMRAPLERFFVRLRMPRLTITAKDLEDRESRDALLSVMGALGESTTVVASSTPRGVARALGTVNLDAIRSLLAELERAPHGSATAWLVNAHLLGERIEHDGGSSETLGRYRTELVRILALLVELPLDEFHRVLTSTVNRGLDEALAAVLDALRSAAHLAVE